jgi:hypothetical protein
MYSDFLKYRLALEVVAKGPMFLLHRYCTVHEDDNFSLSIWKSQHTCHAVRSTKQPELGENRDLLLGVISCGYPTLKSVGETIAILYHHTRTTRVLQFNKYPEGPGRLRSDIDSLTVGS